MLLYIDIYGALTYKVFYRKCCYIIHSLPAWSFLSCVVDRSGSVVNILRFEEEDEEEEEEDDDDKDLDKYDLSADDFEVEDLKAKIAARKAALAQTAASPDSRCSSE